MMKSRRYKQVAESAVSSLSDDSKMKSIKQFFRWNTTPKPVKILLIVIGVYLFLTELIWRGAIREFCLINLSSSEQWMHIKRHFQIPFINDIFEPIYLSDINYFENSSIAIVGMIRNHDHTIKALMKQLDNLSCLFNVSAVLIYESNSNDKTPKLLNEWKIRHNKNNYLCHKYRKDASKSIPIVIKKLLKPKVDPGMKYNGISRLDKYSEYRNYLLNQVYNLSIDFDYFVPIDLDIYGFDILRVLTQLQKANESNISVMCLNGIRRTGYMYDSLAAIAINDKTEKDEDDPIWFYYLEEVERSNIIYSSNEFTNMLSCFGAMAFYNFHDIRKTKCRYMTSDDAKNRYPFLENYYYINKRKGDIGICEHIPFNYCLHDKGKKLAIAKDAYLYYGFNH